MRLRKILILFVIFVSVTAVILIPKAEGRIQPYFNGEAISYKNTVIFGSINTGRMELFVLDNDQIEPVTALTPDDREYNYFNDLLFRKEDASLFVYLVNGRSMYKYDISDTQNIRLVEKVKDNSNDYFYGLGKAGKNIFTVGEKGVKVWNGDLAVIDSYNKIDFKNPKSIVFSRNGNYIFNTNGGYLNVMDSFYRDLLTETKLFVRGDHSIRPYVEDAVGLVYLVDDYSFKKIDQDGKYREFKHISNIGYDVDGSANSDYVYFSDGIGLVKIRKSDLIPMDWRFTTTLGAPDGWAMGLRVVENNGSDNVILFNGSSILAFDQDLNLLDSYQATEEKDFTPAPLHLSVDRNRAAVNSLISLQGGGFGAKEDIKITFAGENFYTTSNEFGDFSLMITVPNKPGITTDIKVDGMVSGLTYSTNFKIE
jgi:hypothetical protein